jgi:Flp pilus assembly protein TadG
MSPGRRGRGKSLTLERACADNPCVRSARGCRPYRFRSSLRDASGQGLVEFALLAPLFLLIVTGFIQFAVGLNFWLDMQRVANKGARSAAVNCGVSTAPQCGSNLASFLSAQIISGGNAPSVEICYVTPSPNNKLSELDPDWIPSRSDAVRVTLTQKYQLSAIVKLGSLNLRARAIQRLEQDPKDPALPDRNNQANWILDSHTGGAACAP